MLRTEGLLNLLLARAGIGPLNLLYNDGAVLLGQVYGELPFMILPLYASLERLDPSLLGGGGPGRGTRRGDCADPAPQPARDRGGRR